MLAGVKSKVETVRACVAQVTDAGAVALGKVALAASNKINEMVDDEPPTKVTAKTTS